MKPRNEQATRRYASPPGAAQQFGRAPGASPGLSAVVAEAGL